LIFISSALSITGLILIIAVVARSDYTIPREILSNNSHQNAKVHSFKNFTAAAQLVDTPPPIHPKSSLQNQDPNFSAFDTRNTSSSLGNSNESISKSNTSAATLNDSHSNMQNQDPAQLPFGLQSGFNSKSNVKVNPHSDDDNTVEGTKASHTAESLIGSLMSPRTLLSTAMSEIGNSTKNNDSGKTKQVQLVTPHTSTILLSNQLIPSKDYLYLYDSIVKGNVTGNLVARLPCNSNMKSSVLILAGYLPRLKPISEQAQPISGMSSPGFQCIYGLQLSQKSLLPRPSTTNNTVLDVALYNPTKQPIRLPPGSSITVNLYDSTMAL
jgi:hypothetical protein